MPVRRRPSPRVSSWSVLFLLLCSLLLLGSTPSIHGQSLAGLGALNGSVEDPGGAAVPNASVEVTNASLGIDRKVTATDAGLFFAPSLPPASGYVVTVSAPGFSTAKTTDITVHVGEELAVPIKLALASANQTITVSENTASMLDPSKTEVSALVNQQQIMNLPINGRRADQFTLLSPGVVPDATSG